MPSATLSHCTDPAVSMHRRSWPGVARGGIVRRSAEPAAKPRHWPSFAAVIAVLCWLGATPNTRAAVAVPDAPISTLAYPEQIEPPGPYDTYERLLEILELFYALLGQVFPESSPATAEGWFNLITARYNTSGVPASLTEAERAQGRAWIVEIKSLMQSIPQMLDPQAAASFNQTLNQIYADLGG